MFAGSSGGGEEGGGGGNPPSTVKKSRLRETVFWNSRPNLGACTVRLCGLPRKSRDLPRDVGRTRGAPALAHNLWVRLDWDSRFLSGLELRVPALLEIRSLQYLGA